MPWRTTKHSHLQVATSVNAYIHCWYHSIPKVATLIKHGKYLLGIIIKGDLKKYTQQWSNPQSKTGIKTLYTISLNRLLRMSINSTATYKLALSKVSLQSRILKNRSTTTNSGSWRTNLVSFHSMYYSTQASKLIIWNSSLTSSERWETISLNQISSHTQF